MDATHPNAPDATPADVLGAVLTYRAQGLCVTDSPYRAKFPPRPNWEDERPTEDELRTRFGDTLKNVSLLTGSASGGIIDRDGDCIEAVRAAEHFFPPTRAIFGRPGRRRAHGLYQLAPVVAFGRRKYTDPVLKIPNPKTGKLKPLTLLELRGDRHQTIVPPSWHEDTGEFISWDEAGEPAPVALDTLERAAQETAACAMLALRWPRLNGSRHEAALALAGFLLRAGMDLERAERFLVALADAAESRERAGEWVRGLHNTAARLAAGGEATGGHTLIEQLGDGGEKVIRRLCTWLGLTDTAEADTEHLASDGASDAPATPPIDIFPQDTAFPLDTLPAWLQTVVADVADRIGCDVALPATAALAVAAGALDDRHQFQPHPDDPTYRVAARLWICAVAKVGDGKSPAQDAMIDALREVDRRWAREDGAAASQFALARRSYERRLKLWDKAENVGEGPTPPAEPPRRQRLVVDFTSEELAHVLAHNPGGVLVHADELAGLIGSLDCYRAKGVHRDRSLLLQLFDGRPRRVDRVKEQFLVPNWGASILGGIQPDVLFGLAPTLTADGFFARYLVCRAQPADLPTRRAPDLAALARWQQAIDALAAHDPDPGLLVTAAPDVAQHRELVTRWARNIQLQPEVPTAFHGALAKLDSQWARLAFVLHCLQEPAAIGPMLHEDVAEAAARLLLDYFIPQVAQFYAHSRSPALSDARWIADWMLARRVDRFTARDVLRAYRALHGEPRRLDAAMSTLEDTNWVTRIASPRRDSTAWTVNHLGRERYAERARTERQRRDAELARIRAARAELGLNEADT